MPQPYMSSATPDTSLMDVDMESATPPAPVRMTEMEVGESVAAVPGIKLRAPKRVPLPAPPDVPAPADVPAPPDMPAPAGALVVPKKAARVPEPRKPSRTFGDAAHSYVSHHFGAEGMSVLRRPEVLLGYAQFLFNASILLVFLYLLFSIVWTIQRDVSQKVHEYEIGEIAGCNAAYAANRCGTDLQAPALTEACATWHRCGSRDHTVVGRARVTAETFAEILNGFVDAVSWKTMVRLSLLTQLFSLLILSIVVGATNSTLSFFRVSASNARNGAPYSYAPAYSIPPDWETHAPHMARIRARASEEQ
ncbi:hypothetical protein MVES_001435 [Malassezia vespertilionis]|uniref:Brl1/Brr6 domain-containing protein n=1 Tax=Malassezia vespertilionis TaxID=2020962 RepID=A0A2N1JCD8_9BASI|nr:hypothetical protein MVES_001435 [Malassezia vespertilionis]